MEYIHPALGREVEAPAGYYRPREELRLTYGGREILCLVGEVRIESSCCGTGSWTYVQVPGFIRHWHRGVTGAGAPVSDIELVSDGEARTAIRKTLRELYPNAHIEICSTAVAGRDRQGTCPHPQ